MANYVDIRELIDASLLDQNGFPTELLKKAVREQRKHGTNSWDKKTKIGKSIWDSAGKNYEGIERLPYRFDYDISGTSYVVKSGSGPKEDLKALLRADIPLDVTMDIEAIAYTTSTQTISNPIFNLDITFDGYAKRNIFTPPEKDYSIVLTLEFLDPNSDPLDLTTVEAKKTISGIETALFYYDDDDDGGISGGEQINRNIKYEQILYYNDSGELVPMLDGFIITNVLNDISAASPSADLLGLPIPSNWNVNADSEWSLEAKVTYNVNTNHTWLFEAGATVPPTGDQTYTIAFDTQSLETKTYISYCVGPFIRSDATFVEGSSEFIDSVSYNLSNIDYANSGNLFSDYADVIVNLQSLFAGYRDLTDRIIKISGSGTWFLKCVQNETVVSGTDLSTLITYNIGGSDISTDIAYADIGSIVKISAKDVLATHFLNKLSFDVKTISSTQTAQLSEEDVELNDVRYIDITDFITTEFSLTPGVDTFDINVKSFDETGFTAQYEPYRVILKRVRDIDDDILFVSTGYYWINEEEKYLYDDETDILLTGGSLPAIVNNEMEITAALGISEILNFSKITIEASTPLQQLVYDYEIDAVTGAKSVANLTASFYFDYENNKIVLSPDVEAITSIRLQTDSDRYINTNLYLNPLVTWKRRYFLEYSEYDQVLTSIEIEKYDGLINAYAYDQHDNPISGLSLFAGEVNGSNRNWNLIDTDCTLSGSMESITNDEGRATFYFVGNGENDTGIYDNVIRISHAEEGSIVTDKDVTINSDNGASNTSTRWKLESLYSDYVRVGSSVNIEIHAYDSAGDEIQITSDELSTWFRTYYENGYIGEDDNWNEISGGYDFAGISEDNIVMQEALKKAIYKITITPTGKDPKTITFRSY